ncbi:MAG TPA: hypothetical protein VEW27_18695 [Methylomirabilota bacterium]|nr:hypothetical protein [Methylomirabilota bacterium]
MRVRVFALALMGACAAGAGADEAQLLVTVGEVTESSAVMWVRGGDRRRSPLATRASMAARRGRRA